jgi:hypothetical protein
MCQGIGNSRTCRSWVRREPRLVAQAGELARFVKAVVALGCDRLYVKVDLTMRGSVAGQLRGALDEASHPGGSVRRRFVVPGGLDPGDHDQQ